MYANDPFDGCEFPATSAELIKAVGDAEIELPNGTEAVATAVERGGGERFETRTDAREALYCGVGEAAIGRKGYSDRDPTPLGVDGPMPLSF